MDNSKYISQERYHKKVGMIQVKINLSPKTEQDIIDAIRAQGVGNQASYIKKLIREDIARKNSSGE